MNSPYSNVSNERDRQNKLKAAGRFNYTCADGGLTRGERLAILAEEFGEVARQVNELREFAGATNDPRYLEMIAKLWDELVETAAVSVAWLEYMHSVNGGPPKGAKRL